MTWFDKFSKHMNVIFTKEDFNAYKDMLKKEAILKYLKPGSRILETGSGLGCTSVPLSALGFDVTSMTTPDFIQAMEIASAFITDEGGITCHAAIIAREMNKPCIIGTKTATKTLKDDDIVEINKGIIQISKPS